MARLIEKAGFAEKVGVSRSAVTQATKPGAALHEALVEDKIDLDSVCCKRYLAKKKLSEQQLLTLGLSTAELNDLQPALAPQIGRVPVHEETPGSSPRGSAIDITSNDLMNHFGNMTLFDIIKKHGSDNAFVKIVQAMKQVAEVEEKQLKLAKQRGEVIDRELVRRHLFGAIDAGNLKLLNDLPGSITRSVYSASKAGQRPEEAEKEVREMISSILQEVKTSAKRRLSRA
jgi:hypothetical protein